MVDLASPLFSGPMVDLASPAFDGSERRTTMAPSATTPDTYLHQCSTNLKEEFRGREFSFSVSRVSVARRSRISCQEEHQPDRLFACYQTDSLLCFFLLGSLSRKTPLSQRAENEKQEHTGGGLWRVCSLEDIRKMLLRWERSPSALEAEAKAALELEKPFSGSLTGDENEGFSSRNGGGDGPCVFQMPLHYPRYSKADYESMPEWKLDNLFHEYGLPIRGDVAFKWSYAMGTFLWPDQL